MFAHFETRMGSQFTFSPRLFLTFYVGSTLYFRFCSNPPLNKSKIPPDISGVECYCRNSITSVVEDSRDFSIKNKTSDFVDCHTECDYHHCGIVKSLYSGV